MKNNNLKLYPTKGILLPFFVSLAVISIGLIIVYNPSAFISYERGQFDNYPYSYNLQSDSELKVLFSEKRLPKDYKIIFAANRDVIKRVFDEDVLEPISFIKRADYNDGFTEIRLSSSKSVFFVKLLELDDRILSMTIIREAAKK